MKATNLQTYGLRDVKSTQMNSVPIYLWKMAINVRQVKIRNVHWCFGVQELLIWIREI